MQEEADLHFHVLAYFVTFRIHSRPGQRSKISEAISVARFHSVPPTSPGFGYKESGSRTTTSSNTGSGINGKMAIM